MLGIMRGAHFTVGAQLKTSYPATPTASASSSSDSRCLLQGLQDGTAKLTLMSASCCNQTVVLVSASTKLTDLPAIVPQALQVRVRDMTNNCYI